MKTKPKFISGIMTVTGYIMTESNEILKHQQKQDYYSALKFETETKLNKIEIMIAQNPNTASWKALLF